MLNPREYKAELGLCVSGHGGDGFLKFQDAEEISNVELADAFEQMWQKRRSAVWILQSHWSLESLCPSHSFEI